MRASAYSLVRPLLFHIDPERAHELALAALRPLQLALQRAGPTAPVADPILSQELWGLTFPNPVGLAAGFDKNGELPHVWASLGFGFAELGTITAQAQEGNPRPRMFRLPADRALINRLGFNNRGAAAVARELTCRLGHRRPPIPLGINLGKSGVTPLDAAAADYCASLRAVFALADYLTVNVSSPNTPGLRDLQSADQLARLLDALGAENEKLAREHGLRPRPFVVKIAPELSEGELRALAAVVRERGVAGLIATNTTIERPTLRTPAPLASEAGGLSGAPLRERSTAVIRLLYRLTEGTLPIIGVGGIFTAEDAYEKIRAGASLVQVYTGFVYGGPGLPRRLCRGLRQLLERDGLANIFHAVGRDLRF